MHINKKNCQQFVRQCEVMSELSKYYNRLKHVNKGLIDRGQQRTSMYKDNCRRLCEVKEAIKLTNKGLEIVVKGIVIPGGGLRNGIVYPVKDPIDVSRCIQAVKNLEAAHKKPIK